MNEEPLKNYIQTDALVEQHIHGGFGIDFAVCEAKDFLEFSKKILDFGVCAFLPTLATDSLENLKRQISRVKEAISLQNRESGPCAKILGVNLEACFLNPEKKGIHDENLFLAPTVENYKLLEDEIIKIVTLAPELDENFELCKYLKSKGVIVSAGHCKGSDLSAVNQVTHLFNAMGEFSHKKPSTVVSALSDDQVSVELIADFEHVQQDVLRIVFKTKPFEKIILVSDALPIAHSEKSEMDFCGKKVFLKDGKAVDKNATMAGSSDFTSDIIKKLVSEGMLDLETAVKMASENIEISGKPKANILWDDDLNVQAISF